MEYTTELLMPTDVTRLMPNKSISINETVDLNSSTTKASFYIYDYLIPTIGAIIILTNLVVVISSGLILKKGQQPRSTYLFLGNIAMTDLITGIAVVLGQVFPKESRNHYICAIMIGMIVSSTLTSVCSVGLIAVDRFLYILHGMHYQRWVYPTRARLLICMAWLIGLIIGFLPLMGWHGDTNNGEICWFIILAPKELVLLTVLIGMIPILTVIFLYSLILYHAIKKIIQLQRPATHGANVEENVSSGNIRMFKGGSNTTENEETPDAKEKGILRYFRKKPASSVKSPNKWKAIKVVLFTTGSFIITWCPYFITSLIYVFNCDIDNTAKRCKTMRTLIASPLAILGFMNSFLNPVIYAWWHKGFRTFLKKKVNSIAMHSTYKDENNSQSQSKSTSSKNSALSDSKNNKASRSKSSQSSM